MRCNCMEEGKKCNPQVRRECALRVPMGFQMVDNERKMRGFQAVMNRFGLKVEMIKNSFNIVNQ